jgi:hypothetical protein
MFKFIWYGYKAYGLSVKSSIILPELVTYDIKTAPDIEIIECSSLSLEANHNIQFNANRVLLHIDEIGSFLIENGMKISFCKDEHCNNKAFRTLLLGSVFSVIFFQRGILPIHGSAVEFGGKCYLIAGPSGVGKSTCAAYLIRKGCRFLSDDVSVLEFDESGTVNVKASYPQQKLMYDTAENLSYDLGSLPLASDDENKYAVPMKDVYLDSAIPLRGLYELCKTSITLPAVTEINGAKRLETIFRNIYQSNSIKTLTKEQHYFEFCADLANQIKVFNVERPELGTEPWLAADVIFRSILQQG